MNRPGFSLRVHLPLPPERANQTVLVRVGVAESATDHAHRTSGWDQRGRHGADAGHDRSRLIVVGERLEPCGEPLVVLEGSPAFYRRLGFEHSVACGIHIELPPWAPPEAAQIKRLGSYDHSIVGRVVYPPAFDEVPHT